MSGRSWNRGSGVRIRLDDGTFVAGQVWDEGDREGTVWVALTNGLYARVITSTGRAEIVTAKLELVQGGKVAA